MAEGLEKMVEASMRTPTQPAAQLFNGGFQYANEQYGRPADTSTAQMDFLTGQTDFGAMGRDDSFMIPDFGLSNSFLPFEDPSTVFRSSEFGYL